MTRSAVVLPGGRFGPHTPTLAYPRFAAEARGATIRAIEWDDPDAAVGLSDDERVLWMRRRLDGVLPRGERPLLIGRSLGSYGAVLAAELRSPAIWVSPLLSSTVIVDALRRASAPVLLAGGTEDPHWDSALAHEVADVVVELTGADHGVMVPGSLARSAAALGELAVAVEAFLDELDPDDWPG